MTTLALRLREWVRDLSLARKVIAVIMGVTSTALVLACLALVAYDTSTARTSLTRDIGILADVVGTTSIAAVSFSDAKGATETLNAVAARDRSAIRTASHALRGAAGNFFATPVAECAGALELMAADGAFDPITADAAYARLEAESARLVAVLRAGLMAPVRRNVEP